MRRPRREVDADWRAPGTRELGGAPHSVVDRRRPAARSRRCGDSRTRTSRGRGRPGASSGTLRGRTPSCARRRGPTMETTTPVRPSAGPGDVDAARLELRGDEPAGSVVATLRDAARLGAERAAHAATFAAWPPAPVFVVASASAPAASGSLELHDHVEQGIADRHDQHRRIVPWTATRSAAVSAPSSSAGSSARQRPSRRLGAGASASRRSDARRRDSRPSRGRRVTAKWSSESGRGLEPTPRRECLAD